MADSSFAQNPAKADAVAEAMEEHAVADAINNEPWRSLNAQRPVGEGITYHSGPEERFGLHVSSELNEEIDPLWREPNGWYEGVEKWPIVAISFPDQFEDSDVENAHEMAKAATPEAYEAFTARMAIQPDPAKGYNTIGKYYGEGVSLVETPIETRLHVSQELNEKIDPAWRQPDGRYDAANQSSIIALSFPERFDAAELAAARQDVKDRYPDIYEKVIARMAPPRLDDEDNFTTSPEAFASKPASDLKELIAAFDPDAEPVGKAADKDAASEQKEPEYQGAAEHATTAEAAEAPEIKEDEKPAIEEVRAETTPESSSMKKIDERLVSADEVQTPSTPKNPNPAAKIENQSSSLQSHGPQGSRNDPQQNYDRTHQPVTAPITAAAVVAATVVNAFRRNLQDNRPTPLAAEPAPKEPAASSAQPSENVSAVQPESVAPAEPAVQANSTAGATSSSVGGSLPLRNLLTGFRSERSDSIAAQETSPPVAGSPAQPGSARALLEKFDRFRMQPRRDADQLQATERAGAAAVQSFEALETADSSAILTRIREAAEAAPGGMKEVLSEMRPGGAYEDLRKEFNATLERDEHFSTAYENAASALGAYGDQRKLAAPILQKGNIGVLARLEALDQQIVKASAGVPGKEAGKSALDEALEKGHEALTRAVEAVRNVFSRQGPSASPSISP